MRDFLHSARKRFGWTGSLIGIVTLSACASIVTQLPDIDGAALETERTQQENLALSEVKRLQERLGRVLETVLAANAELCPKVDYSIGVKTHRLLSYPKVARAAAAREYGAKETPSVIYILPDSPAEQAGLQIGDQILNAEGRAVPVHDTDLQAQFKQGDPEISIRRDGEILNLSITPYEVCGYRGRLSVKSEINAYANGRTITVTSGMMNFVETDDELALIIGHELAHNTLGHIRKIVGNMILSGFTTRYTRPFESEADYVGLYYMARAGYNPEGVEAVWRRMGAVNIKSVVRAKTHPSFPDRYLRLAAAYDEIKAKQKAGMPLIPNFKTSKS